MCSCQNPPKLAAMSHRRLFPMLLLLCIWLLSIHLPSVSSSLSFDVQFIQWGYDPQEVLFHQIRNSPKNLSGGPYTVHRRTQVLPRKKRKKFVPDRCDCSRIDGVMYARPAPLRDEATDEVASFKTTLCLKIDREGEAAGRKPHGHCGRIGLFLFLVPYPWNANDERIEVGLDNNCTETELDRSSSSIGSEAVVCAHVHYDSTKELLLANVRIGGRSCMAGKKLERSHMPKAAAVGFASTTAGDPIKWENILTWAFHSTLESESKRDPRLMTPQPQVETGDEGSWIDRGQQRLRVDPWNRNAELNLRYHWNWQPNWPLTCSVSISVNYGNANDGMN